MYRSSRPELLCKKVLLEISQNSQENTCARVSFLIKLKAKACNFIKKETLAQVFSREFFKISKNTFFHRTPLLAVSMCIPSFILDFCFILVASNTVIWACLFGAHRFKLEVENFIFHVVVFFRKTFQVWHGNSCFVLHKKILGLIFFLILFSCST